MTDLNLNGWHGADFSINDRSSGDDAIMFKMISNALRETRADAILGKAAMNDD